MMRSGATPRLWRPALVVALLIGSLASCGGEQSSPTATPPTTSPPNGFAAQIASFEVVAGRPSRVLGALAGSGTGTVVSFGEVQFAFSYLGTADDRREPPEPGPRATAAFLPIPGRDADPDAAGPRETKPSEGLGVYAAHDVVLPHPGFWQLEITADLVDAEEISATAAFEVVAEPRLPYPGQPAPRTQSPTVNDAGEPASSDVEAVAIDSRAAVAADGRVPDIELHQTSVADAIAAGQPVVVVVSTPVYCVSKFCGPVTDTVADLARDFGDRAAFVHLEVWADFASKQLTPWAREWIFPEGRGDANEPWVFLVDADGVIAERYDNVVSDGELRAAVERLVA